MNKKIWLLVCIVLVLAFATYFFLSKRVNAPDTLNESSDTSIVTASEIKITPVSHATMALEWGELMLITDPVGDREKIPSGTPDMILITDIHGDHLNTSTLSKLSGEETVIIAPVAVADSIRSIPGQIKVLKNGETVEALGVKIEAVPMYNFPETSDSRHAKGRGNGYVLEKMGERVYIAGDTSGTPEMRSLKNIDLAFIPMNLPFTMSVDEAASAVLDFKPKKVIPYHYRGSDGLSDINKFKELVTNQNPEIKVELLNFYQ
jgi:L-ascorbate metabolism protein UlaG (beta-lactamase superfamily)